MKQLLTVLCVWVITYSIAWATVPEVNEQTPGIYLETGFSPASLNGTEELTTVPRGNHTSTEITAPHSQPLYNPDSYVSYYKENLPAHFLDAAFVAALGASWAMGALPQLWPFAKGLFLADFTTAHYHWLEDSYDQFIPSIILCPNRLHHFAPKEMITHDPFYTLSSTLVATVPLGIMAWMLNAPASILYGIGLATLSNWVHQMSHHRENDLWDISYILWALQKVGIMQSGSVHRIHHSTEDRNHYYSVMTNYLNPLFESVNYWRNLEWVIEIVSGEKPRLYTDEESYRIHCHERDPESWPAHKDLLRRDQFPEYYSDD